MNFTSTKKLPRRKFIKRLVELTLLMFSKSAFTSDVCYEENKLILCVDNLSNKVLNDENLKHVFKKNTVEKFLNQLGEMNSEDTKHYINQKIDNDFENSHVFLIEGYVFSETEILICLSCNHILRS